MDYEIDDHGSLVKPVRSGYEEAADPHMCTLPLSLLSYFVLF